MNPKDSLKQLGEALQNGTDVTIEKGGKVKPPHPDNPHHGKPDHGDHHQQVKPARTFGGSTICAPAAKATPWNILHPSLHKADVEAMSEWYPQFTEVKDRNNRVLGWTGTIAPIEEGESFLLKVAYPQNYPPATPRIWIIQPDIFRLYPGHPHIFGDGAICSFFPPDKSWIAGKNTIADLLNLAAIWLVGHLYWKEFGIWPIKSVDNHDPKHLQRTVKPNAPCWCGSGIKHKKCCLNRLFH